MIESAGFVGVGTMGGAMAMRLLDAGYPLVIYDPDEAAVRRLADRGAKVAGSPREVADQAETIFTSLNTADISRQVALGADGIIHGSAVKLLIETSTIGAQAVRDIAAAMQKAGIGLLDAPVSGGRRGAEVGTLAIMIAGAHETFKRARPTLQVVAGSILYVGEEPGLAQSAKVVNNILSIVGIVATAEALVCGVKAGLDANVLIDLINASSGRNAATLDKFPTSILTRRFDFAASLANQLKTLSLFSDETERLGTPGFVVPRVQEVYRKAFAEVLERGESDCDASEIVRYVERLAKTEIAGESFKK